MPKDEDDIEWFWREMEGVTPLKPQSIKSSAISRQSAPGILERRRYAVEELEDPNFLILSNPESVAPFDPIEFKKDSVPNYARY